MKKTLTTKNIIVAGGSGGIGGEVAASFLAQGENVLIIGRSKKDLTKKKKDLSQLKGTLYTKSVDVSEINQVKKIKSFIDKVFKRKVDALINAAAIYGPMGPLEKQDISFWEQTIKVNLMGTVNMTAFVIPYMKRRKQGKIINFSGGGEGAFPRFTAYSASKGAVVRFTESIAAELAPYNIYVNAIAPGAVNTGLLEEVLKAGKKVVGDDFYKSSLEQSKSGGVPSQKAAELIKFLVSDSSKNMSGKVISAIWDNWINIPKHLAEIKKSDIYNFRRIKPADRGHDWK